MSLVKGLICIVLMWSLCGPASANLRLSRFFVEAQQDSRPEEVFISNDGNETLYVRVTVEEVINPQDDEPTVVTGLSPDEMGILVSPQRLVINPGEDKRIRIVTLQSPDEDRFFKVTVTPVVGDIESNTAIGVKLMIAYGIWVFARPTNSQPDIVGEVQGRDLVLRNVGGTHGEIRDIVFCPEQLDDSNPCQTLDGFRLMLGKDYLRSFDGPGTATVKSMFKGTTAEASFSIE